MNKFEKFKLRLAMPKIPKQMINDYVLINQREYNEIKRMIEKNRQEIDELNSTNDLLVNAIYTTLDKLNLIETARRKNAGKVGGLQKALNKEVNKNEEYKRVLDELNDNLVLKQLESEQKDAQIKILKNNGKKKQIEDYQKLEELTKDIEKHKKGK